MDYFVFVSNLLLPILQLLIIQKYMNIFLGPGNQKYAGCIGWVVYYVFLVAISTGMHFPSILLLAGNILLVFIISTITRRKSLKSRFIFTILICTMWMLVEVIVLKALEISCASESVIENAGSFISKMSMLFLSVLIGRYSKGKTHYEIPLQYFFVILLIPVSSIYIMHHIFLIAAEYEEYAVFSSVTSFLLLLVNYVIFEVYDWMGRDAGIRAQNCLYEQQLELCSRQSEEREHLYRTVRQMRHDMKNYLSGLLGMVQAGKMEEASDYIQAMLDDGISDRTEEISCSGNIVVDSLINHKYALALKDNIRFDATVFIPSALPFHNGHLSIIIGNLLENALEACKKLQQDQRYINLEVLYVKEVLQIHIKNSCLPDCQTDNTGKYLTTKKNKDWHGLGMSSIEQTVECYHGEINAENRGTEFEVTVIMYGSIQEK